MKNSNPSNESLVISKSRPDCIILFENNCPLFHHEEDYITSVLYYRNTL